MKFIADVMLGRLAKRLRLLGFDVLYDRAFIDNEIIRLSLEQGRIILTRIQMKSLKRTLEFVRDEFPDVDRVCLLFVELEGFGGTTTRCSGSAQRAVLGP